MFRFMFLAKLNDMEVWGADIGNMYQEAITKEKLYVVAGPEFEDLEQCILVIYIMWIKEYWAKMGT